MPERYVWKLTSGRRVSLDDLDPRHDGGVRRAEAPALQQALEQELSQLQELCYAAQHHAVLIVLQGMDTSGKDGSIKHVMDAINPQGCRVTAFKVPTALEQAHDFLWRAHAAAPELGTFGIFNRSHYEDVLIVRVHGLVPEAVWRRRYGQINHFERLLADSRTIILKFFLHISKEEQGQRLKDRERDPLKRWKLNAGDYKERDRWNEYMRVYEDALAKCSRPHAPWYVVPADRKWFRDLAVAHTLVSVLRPYRRDWERTMRARGERNYEELLRLRAQGAVPD